MAQCSVCGASGFRVNAEEFTSVKFGILGTAGLFAPVFGIMLPLTDLHLVRGTVSFGLGPDLVLAVILVFVGYLCLRACAAQLRDRSKSYTCSICGNTWRQSLGAPASVAAPSERRAARPSPSAFVRADETPPLVDPTVRGKKVCPDCAETVQAAARICRYCRHEFAPGE